MNADTQYQLSGYSGFSISRAQGPDADTVEALFGEVQKGFLDSQSLGGAVRKAASELADTFLDCFHADWDGYKALPVKADSYQNAKRFLESLGGVWPQPTVSADPDGEISLEWYRGRRMRFSVSIGPDATVSYAGMFATSTVHGTETFLDEVPTGVLQHLHRLYRLPD